MLKMGLLDRAAYRQCKAAPNSARLVAGGKQYHQKPESQAATAIAKPKASCNLLFLQDIFLIARTTAACLKNRVNFAALLSRVPIFLHGGYNRLS